MTTNAITLQSIGDSFQIIGSATGFAKKQTVNNQESYKLSFQFFIHDRLVKITTNGYTIHSKEDIIEKIEETMAEESKRGS